VRGNYPTIAKGMGKLTPQMWDRLMDALRFYEQKSFQLEIKKPEARQYPLRPPSPIVILSITDAVEVAAGWRWTYGWSEMVLDAGVLELKQEGRTHNADGYGRAINPEEQANVQGSVSGYGIPASNGLATATPQPLASGSIVPAVLLRDRTDEVLRPVLMPATNPLTIACVSP
jgi:hypothetical protein